MKIIDLQDGYFKLTAENGIMDKRNGRVYSEVVITEDKIKYFVENT